MCAVISACASPGTKAHWDDGDIRLPSLTGEGRLSVRRRVPPRVNPLRPTRMRGQLARVLLPLALAAGGASLLSAQQPDNSRALHWRQIGPVRAGRARALSGVPSQPNVFYIGFDNGGVWRSTDYGSTWVPLFDDQPTGSIGAIAVAPSDPNIIYVGSGAGIIRPDLATGDGVYKSTDGGKTWTHLGLRDTQMIAMIDVDPRDPNRLFVAALGHPYGPNAERGIFRSTDGGQTFQKVLFKDEYTSGNDVRIDPDESEHRVRDAVAAAAELHRGRRASAAPATASSSPRMAARPGSS